MLLIGASRAAMMIYGQLGWLHTFISHGWVFAHTQGSVHSFIDCINVRCHECLFNQLRERPVSNTALWKGRCLVSHLGHSLVLTHSTDNI